MVFSSTLRASLSLAAFVAAVNGHWIFGGTQPIVTTRIDSIVNPGGIGTHVHSVVGGSRFKNIYDPDDLVQSQCSTIVVQPDKSNYWAPQLYYQDQNTHQFTAIPTSFNVYYLPREGPSNEPIKAFPKGLRMLAGDTNRRSNNASNFADQAVSFVCLDYSGAHNGDPDWAERPNFFDHNCPNGMRAQIFFPTCWDGQNLDSADHKSHMAYPIQNYNSGDCPASHPVHLVSLFYEMLVSVDQFPYWGPGSWVFANGDPTGYAMHGDFVNGWEDLSLLQNAIDNCPNANGNVAACPPLAAVMDQAAASACQYEGQVVNEDVGLKNPIAALPGCNPVWDGTGTKPTCGTATTPALVAAQEPMLAGWTDMGCITESTNGRAFTGASTTDSQKMTKNVCAAFCASKGFRFAGVEFGDECYCDNAFRNGASNTTVPAEQCNVKCAGNSFEDCGGPQRLTFMYNPTPGKTPVSTAAPSVPSAASSTAASVPSSSHMSVSVSSVAAASSVVTSASSSHISVSTSSTRSSGPATSNIAVALPSVSVSASASSVRASTSASSVLPSAPISSVLASAPVSSAVQPSASASPAGPSNSTGSAIPAGWVAAGCVADVPGRALQGFSVAADSMTASTCVSTCASKGFSLAGAEYGRECYCGNVYANGGGATLDASKCNMKCTDGSQCGGPMAMTLFKNTAAPAAQALPSGWAAAGCVSDVPARAINAYSFTSDTLTAPQCASTCASKGFSIAAIEYGRECYCGNGFTNGGGATLDASKCNMACTFDGSACGGSWALSVYKKTTSNKRSKHFGRAHGLRSDIF